MGAPKKKPPKKTGRPTKYSSYYSPMMANLMAGFGWIDIEMAARMGISESTFHKWKLDHPEFAEAIANGKVGPDDRVEAALYQRAIGYRYTEQVAMQYMGEVIISDIEKEEPANVTAAMYILNNRRKDKWKHIASLIHSTDADNLSKFADALSKAVE